VPAGLTGRWLSPAWGSSARLG